MSKTKKAIRKRFKFLPLTIGIETVGGIATPLALRGTPLPAKRSQTFSTAEDDQKEVEVKVYIGERPIASENHQLNHLSLINIPPAPKGVPQISLTIEVDEYCDVKAAAIEQTSDISVSVESKDSDQELSETLINSLLKQAEKNKPDDQKKLKKIEEKLRRDEIIFKAEALLRDDQKKKYYKFKEIEKTLADLGLSIENNEIEEINLKTDELEKLIDSSTFFGGGFDAIYSSFFKQPVEPPPRKTPKKVQEKIKKTAQKPSTKDNKAEDKPSVGPTKYNIGKIFGAYNFTPDPNLCFVLMPFSDEMRPIYDDHIRPIVEAEDLSCVWADEIVGTNLITYDIWEKINRARFIIADLTRQNPNVFYEVGLSHALGKEVILITQSIDDVPFDLKAMRCIVYSYKPRGVINLEKSLKETIKRIMSAS